MRGAFTTLVFLLPVLVLFGVFRFVPMIGVLGLSLTDYRLGGDWRFTGTANYAELLRDEVFLDSLTTTLAYVALCVPLTVVVALGTALLLDAVRWGRGLFRTALLTPYVTSLVLAGVVWQWLFGPLLNSPAFVLPALAVVGVWKGFGYATVILLAGVRRVPAGCLDAARVDGASAWQRFRHVRLPLLRPVLLFVVVVETIGAFQVFDTIYVMTAGGPVRASYTLAYAIYDYGFKDLTFGRASAAGVVLWAVVLLVSLVQRRVLERKP
ncbi:sugar ABC transporter permease [Lentzea sp.]|uniref:carbohydrate ABC transporter permease n=1 Tax=Lentzea sp. TaxID=56099 RepID=UPI002C4119AF|nr:sugar ABC transporter permease [Lentzea sp.]HUQ59436.1 sugar ABC transporter permease [Lentzea sp.]